MAIILLSYIFLSYLHIDNNGLYDLNKTADMINIMCKLNELSTHITMEMLLLINNSSICIVQQPKLVPVGS